MLECCFNSVRKIPSLVLICITTVTSSIESQVLFQYKHNSGDKWHITSRVNEEVLLDGEILKTVEILNKISVEVLKGDGSDGLIYSHYQIAEQVLGEDFYRWNEEYEVTYGRDARGRLSGLKRNTSIPPVRDVPVYPTEPVETGGTWEARGQEYFDLQYTYNIQEIIAVEFMASYKYEGSEIIDDRKTDRVSIEYSFNWKPDTSLDRRLKKYEIHPVSLEGTFVQNVYWDQIAGRNYAEEGNFSYTYFMNNGHTYTFRGTSHGRAVYAEFMDKESLVKEIENLDSVNAFVTDDGVSLTLDNIHFVPDSADMLPGEKKKLAGIAEILRKIPDRDILIIGHTASVSPDHDGQELSEKRAGAVSRYFTDLNIRKSTQIIVKGMGDSQPLAYNGTEEGRRKNRRVEIIILEN